jgi:transcriptional adapter 2-alpha
MAPVGFRCATLTGAQHARRRARRRPPATTPARRRRRSRPPAALAASSARSAGRSKRRRAAEGAAAAGATPAARAEARRDGLYHCDYCHRDLSAALRAKCDACADFDLCLDCFGAGAELHPHASDHAYRIVDNLSFPVYAPDWGADAEMTLLEAVELFGLGSWARVGEHVGRPADECRAHYMAVYIESPDFPRPRTLPEMAGVDVAEMVARRRARARAGGAAAAAAAAAAARQASPGRRRGRGRGEGEEEGEDGSAAGAARGDSGGEGGEAAGRGGRAAAAAAALPEPPAGARGRRGGAADATPGAALAAPPAETPAAAPAPPPASTGGKSLAAAEATPMLGAGLALAEAQQTGYHVKRNEFQPEYDDEAEHLVAELEFAEGEPEEEAAAKLAQVAIYNRRLDERERRRAFVLERGLLNTRRQGAVDRKRSAAERELVGRLRPLARHLPPAQWEALAEGLCVEGRLRARIAELQASRAAGMRTFDQYDRAAEAEARRRRDPFPAAQPGKSRFHRIPVDEPALAAELAALGLPHAAAALAGGRSLVPEGRGVMGLAAWRGARGALLDVAALPDAPPLSAAERELCAKERYLPAQYLAVKAEVAAAQAAAGSVPRALVLALPFAVDAGRAARLWEFFVARGFCTAPAGEGGGGGDGAR